MHTAILAADNETRLKDKETEGDNANPGNLSAPAKARCANRRKGKKTLLTGDGLGGINPASLFTDQGRKCEFGLIQPCEDGSCAVYGIALGDGQACAESGDETESYDLRITLITPDRENETVTLCGVSPSKRTAIKLTEYFALQRVLPCEAEYVFDILCERSEISAHIIDEIDVYAI